MLGIPGTVTSVGPFVLARGSLNSVVVQAELKHVFLALQLLTSQGTDLLHHQAQVKSLNLKGPNLHAGFLQQPRIQ